jgi:hypothetical protein
MKKNNWLLVMKKVWLGYLVIAILLMAVKFLFDKGGIALPAWLAAGAFFLFFSVVCLWVRWKRS